MVTFIITILALVGIALSCNLFGSADSTPALNETPDFTLPTMTVADITLSELKVTPVVLHFWTTVCHKCVSELPYLENVDH